MVLVCWVKELSVPSPLAGLLRPMRKAPSRPAPVPKPRCVWLTEAQTAERLNMSVKWLQKERLCGGLLRFAKFGSAVRYSLADIESFEQASLRMSTSESSHYLAPGHD